MTTPAEELRISRRVALKWMVTAMGSVALADPLALAGMASGASPTQGHGYGTDLDLTKSYKPGDLWPLTLARAPRRTVTVLCDLIIPADDQSPSASAVGVPDFIDEWISAPYPNQRRDRELVLDGLHWLDEEAQRRHRGIFADLTDEQRTGIARDICYEPEARPELKTAARFFARFRDLTAGGFYTTPEGMRDIRYVGNVPSATFAGPPPELIRQLGLA